MSLIELLRMELKDKEASAWKQRMQDAASAERLEQARKEREQIRDNAILERQSVQRTPYGIDYDNVSPEQFVYILTIAKQKIHLLRLHFI